MEHFRWMDDLPMEGLLLMTIDLSKHSFILLMGPIGVCILQLGHIEFQNLLPRRTTPFQQLFNVFKSMDL